MVKFDRRLHRRFPRRYAIKYGQGEANKRGFTVNMSLGGMAISSATGVQTRHRTGDAADHRHRPRIPLRGISRWNSHKANVGQRRMTFEMGVELTARTPSYTTLLQDIIDQFTERRRAPRFKQYFKVNIEDSDKLMELYTRDISRGGVYVVTKDAPALRSTINVKMYLYDIMEAVRVEGEVVHVLGPEKAKELGQEPGFGVQLPVFSRMTVKFLRNISSSWKRKGPNGTDSTYPDSWPAGSPCC